MVGAGEIGGTKSQRRNPWSTGPFEQSLRGHTQRAAGPRDGEAGPRRGESEVCLCG